MAKSPSTSRKRQRPVSPPPEASTSASPAEVLTTRRSSPLKKGATLTDGPAAAASTPTQAQQGGVESTAVDVNEEATASANQEPAPEPRRSRRLAASEASSSKVGAPSTPAKRKRAASPRNQPTLRRPKAKAKNLLRLLPLQPRNARQLASLFVNSRHLRTSRQRGLQEPGSERERRAILPLLKLQLVTKTINDKSKNRLLKRRNSFPNRLSHLLL
jgi:hypothetical protein